MGLFSSKASADTNLRDASANAGAEDSAAISTGDKSKGAVTTSGLALATGDKAKGATSLLGDAYAVDGKGNSLTVVTQDYSPEIVAAVLQASADNTAELSGMMSDIARANRDTTQSAFDTVGTLSLDARLLAQGVTDSVTDLMGTVSLDNRLLSQSAIDATANTARDAIASNNSLLGTLSLDNRLLSQYAMDTVAGTMDETSRLLNEIFYRETQLTESTRVDNANLARFMTETATTAISDSRRDTNEKILTEGMKYAAIIAGVIAVAVVVSRFKK